MAGMIFLPAAGSAMLSRPWQGPQGGTTEDSTFLGPGSLLAGFRGSHGENSEPESWGNPRTVSLGQHCRDPDSLLCRGRFWSPPWASVQ